MEAHGQVQVVDLPLAFMADELESQYRLSFDLPDRPWNRFWPVTLVVRDMCLDTLAINDQAVPIEQIGYNGLCHSDGIALHSVAPASMHGGKITVVVKKIRGQDFKLLLKRESLLSTKQVLLLLLASVYLWTLGFAHNWKTYKQLHYRWLVFVIFGFAAGVFGNPDDWQQALIYTGTGVVIAVVIAAGCWLAPAQILYTYLDRAGQYLMRQSPAHLACGFMAAFLVMAAILSQVLFDGIPHVADTHIQYVQSKIFAQGKWYETSHPLSHFFDFQNAINDGKYYGGTFPGNPLLLAVMQILGAPWLLNPLMGALTTGVVFFLAYELAGLFAGIASAALMLVSPMITIMSAEYMNHASCMLFVTLFVYGYVRMQKTTQKRHAALLGFSMGMAFLIRAQSAVLVALPFAVHALWWWWHAPRARWHVLAIAFSSFMALICLLLYYQYQTTGSPWISGYDKYQANYPPLFYDFVHADRWLDIGQDLARLFHQMQITNRELFNWPTSAFWGMFLLYWFRLAPPYAGFVLLAIAGQYIGFMFMFRDEGLIFPGNRYVYEASACIILLTGIAFSKMAQWPSMLGMQMPERQARGAVIALLLGLSILAYPYRITELYKQYADDFWEGNWSYYQMLTRSVQTPAVIFIGPYQSYRLTYFAQPPREDSPIIFAMDRGDENKQLMDYYPKRHIYTAQYWHLKQLR